MEDMIIFGAGKAGFRAKRNVGGVIFVSNILLIMTRESKERH